MGGRTEPEGPLVRCVLVPAEAVGVLLGVASSLLDQFRGQGEQEWMAPIQQAMAEVLAMVGADGRPAGRG